METHMQANDVLLFEIRVYIAQNLISEARQIPTTNTLFAFLQINF